MCTASNICTSFIQRTYPWSTHFVYMTTVELGKVSHCHHVHNWTKQYVIQFLGAVAKFRRATISFLASACPSVRPPARMEQLGSHWTDSHDILYLSISRTPDEKIQVSLTSNKNNGYSTWTKYKFYHFLLCVFRKKFVENVKNTHFVSQ